MKDKYVDICVVGGGVAGVAAAFKASQINPAAKILLIERYSVPGGTIVGSLVPYLAGYSDGEKRIIGGLALRLLEELKRENALFYENIDGGMANLAELEVILCRWLREAKVEVWFDTLVAKVEREGDRIKNLYAYSKDGEEKVFSRYFIDATGDADIIYFSKFPYRRVSQPLAYNFFLQMNKRSKKNIKVMSKLKAILGISDLGYSTGIYQGRERWFNTRNEVAYPLTAKKISKFILSMHLKIKRLQKLLNDQIGGVNLTRLATQVGVRASRNLIGEYTLRLSDIKKGANFSDAICHAGYGGKKGIGYDIPSRTLYPKGIKSNIYVAGRCISATPAAQEYIRIIATCIATGEAAGEIVAKLL